MTTRIAWVINTASILALGLVPVQLLAKPKTHAAFLARKVVLMDFRRRAFRLDYASN